MLVIAKPSSAVISHGVVSGMNGVFDARPPDVWIRLVFPEVDVVGNSRQIIAAPRMAMTPVRSPVHNRPVYDSFVVIMTAPKSSTVVEPGPRRNAITSSAGISVHARLSNIDEPIVRVHPMPEIVGVVTVVISSVRATAVNDRLQNGSIDVVVCICSNRSMP